MATEEGGAPEALTLAQEVRQFLLELRQEHPGLYPAAPPARNRETARSLIEERAALWSERMAVAHGRIAIKDQRTLWGSCSAKGNLNFNWRLVFAPRDVLDYVVVHELAHLREMNHSRRFWDLVARFCPEHREHRRWLHENYRSLRRRSER
ncbi:MAG: M48 family metallopeptidase [Elusimicrobia bacterium]|nr:M48 family metallopeptidase [Elusimicrobiota bacterium]